MPKIRQVKPELFTSDTLPPSIEARWLFVGLLTEADDEGRLLDLPKRIAGAIFPHDDVDGTDVAGWIDMLEEHGQVRRYGADGKRCLLIVNFRKHQYIPRPVKSRLPAPPDDTPSEQATCESHVATCGSEAVDMSGSSSSGVRDLGSSSSPPAPNGGEEAPEWALDEVERRYAKNRKHVDNPRKWKAAVLADVLAEPPKPKLLPPLPDPPQETQRSERADPVTIAESLEAARAGIRKGSA